MKALNKAGYTDWRYVNTIGLFVVNVLTIIPSQLPHDAQLLLAQRIHHADNVMIVPKVVEEPVSSRLQSVPNYLSENVVEGTCFPTSAEWSTSAGAPRNEATHRWRRTSCSSQFCRYGG